MKQLKTYQDNAVFQLLGLSNMYLNIPGNETIVLQSPTGSGKTFMITNYIYEMSKIDEYDLCFLWVSIGSGDLHIQSYKSVKRELDEALQCSMLEQEFFGSRTQIERNEIVFVNWEKIRGKDAETGEYTNVLMKDKETINFPEVLENTRNSGRKIVLIIDESHFASTTERAIEIRDRIIQPELTIEMSATPVLMNGAFPVKVNPVDVIDEGMIKNEILINKNIEDVIKVDDELDSESIILESAFNKQQELKEKYKNMFDSKESSTIITPLVIVQLPNSTAGDEKMNNVLKFLETKGYTVDNGKVAIWLTENQINKEEETLLPLDSKVEYLLFKMAIETGWDCPRAQILIKFRETNSITFEIQTVGRILRMPEAHHYSDEDLNRAYVYTNVQSITIKPEVYNPNIIKNLPSKRADKYSELKLKSYYHKRGDQGSITKEFYKVFENEFCNYFNISQIDDDGIITSDVINNNIELLKDKGINIEYDKNDAILNNIQVDSKEADKGVNLDDLSLIGVYASSTDLQTRFEKIISSNLNGFAPKRSIPTVKSAIYIAFKKYLGIDNAKGGLMIVQNAICSNSEVFSIIINTSTKNYEQVHKIIVGKKSTEKFNDEWEVPTDRNYNPDTCQQVDSELSLFQPFYIEKVDGKVNELELSFIKYMDSHADEIEWFWKNGTYKECFFGIQKPDKSCFYPDFLVKFKDGRLGIFDTKGGHLVQDDTIKSDTLYRYIAESRFNGKNIIGGLVIKDNSTFKLYQKPGYKPYSEDPSEWDNLNSLFE